MEEIWYFNQSLGEATKSILSEETIAMDAEFNMQTYGHPGFSFYFFYQKPKEKVS